MKSWHIVFSVCTVTACVWAAGENLLVNPGFEESSCPSSSNNGAWGWYKDGAIATPGWRGGGNAGIAKAGNTTWLPMGTGTWTAYIQRYKPWGAGLNSYIEQTVHIAQFGIYEFSFSSALRTKYTACQIGFSVNDGTTTTEYDPVTCSNQTFVRHTYRVTLEANRDYTFRLHGFDSDINDTTAMVDDCELVYLGDPSTPFTATWTGAKGTVDLLDGGNWDCYDFLGEKMDSTVIPLAGTTSVTIPETSNFSCPAGATNIWREIVFDGTRLQASNDLSGLEFQRAKGTLDLNGRGLVLSEAAGIAYSRELTVENSAAGEPVVVRFAIGAGAVVTNNALAVRGNVVLAKDGAGDLQWGGTACVASEVPIAITDGSFRLGENMAVDIFGSSGTLTVSGTGQLDVNGQNRSSPLVGREIRFEGEGPDGSGAIVNRPLVETSGSVWNVLTMTGDATWGGAGRLEVRSARLMGEDYVLTIKNDNVVALCGSNSYLRVKKLLLTDGGVYAPCYDTAGSPNTQEIPEGIVLTNGGKYEPWANTGLMFDLNPPLVVGEGGGLIGGFIHPGSTATRAEYYQHGRVLVCAGSNLEFGYRGGWYDAITNEVGATISITNTSAIVRVVGVFANAGTVVQAAGELSLGSPTTATQGCALTNDGSIRTTGGTFLFNAASTLCGSGSLELAGAQATLAGSFAGYSGTVRIAGGKVSLAQPDTLTSTLVFVDGQVTTDLSSFRGTAVFDLSAKAGLFDIAGLGWTTLKDIPVTVNLAGRTVAFGEKLLAWRSDEQPAVTFVADAETAAAGVPLVATPTGLFYGADPASTVVDQARWTGAANDGDWTNPQNWSCLNAAGATIVDGLPGAAATVFLANGVKLDIPSGHPFVCARLELTDCALTADCDWRGLDLNAIPAGTVLDLRGHKLLLARDSTALATSFTVTDTQTANYIKNGSFEEQTAISANSGNWGRSGQVTTAYWIFGNQGGGLSRSVATWTTNVRDGSYYGILQVWDSMGTAKETWIAQRVTVPSDGLYRLSFANLSRPQYSKVLQIQVQVDGVDKALIAPPSSSAWDEMVCWLDLTAGEHEIRFVGVRPATSGDYAAFIDQVALTRATDAGELHLDVPAGANFVNDKIVLTGKLRLVKDGAGTLTVARNNQGYTGGTEIAGGTIVMAGAPANWPLGGNGIKRAGAALVKLDPETMLDLNGKTGWGYTTIDFAGGKVRGATTQFNADWLVTADSVLETTGAMTANLYTGVNLNQQTLKIDIAVAKTLTADWSGLSNGRLDIASGGTFAVSKALDARTVDLRMNAAFNLAAALDVRDYLAVYNADYNTGTAALNVWGRFTPMVDYFYGCTLQDGAVLDLSYRQGVWSTMSRFSNGAKTVSFADEATITVDLGTRQIGKGGQVVAWDAAPANLAGLTFKLAASRQGWLEVKPDGIYYRSGMAVIVR